MAAIKKNAKVEVVAVGPRPLPPRVEDNDPPTGRRVPSGESPTTTAANDNPTLASRCELPSNIPTIPHSQELMRRRLHLYLKQQTPFFSRKEKMLRWIGGRPDRAKLLNEGHAFRRMEHGRLGGARRGPAPRGGGPRSRRPLPERVGGVRHSPQGRVGRRRRTTTASTRGWSARGSTRSPLEDDRKGHLHACINRSPPQVNCLLLRGERR